MTIRNLTAEEREELVRLLDEAATVACSVSEFAGDHGYDVDTPSDDPSVGARLQFDYTKLSLESDWMAAMILDGMELHEIFGEA